MTKPKSSKRLDAIVDAVLAYRPKARSNASVQRKRRSTLLKKKREKEAKGEKP
jgi:hypothetical protein